MAIKAFLRSKLRNLKELKWRAYTRRHEFEKYKDPKRIAVYSAVHLTAEQEEKIDRFYLENYGEKIPHTWHRYYTAFTGHFDEHYFPELLFLPEFEHFMNYYQEYGDVIADKNISALLAKAAGIRTPRALLSCTYGLLKDGNGQICTQEQALALLEKSSVCFAKPSVESGQGHGCQKVCIQNGVDTLSGCPGAQLLKKLGDNFVIQELIQCHSALTKLNPGCVNTFRIVTYRWGNELRCLPIIMRLGRDGNCVDNAHAGGLLIALDFDGALHKRAFSFYGQPYLTHPDTGVVFENYRIPNVDKLVNAARAMHLQVPQLGIAHWDFTLDQDGEPVFIEANTIPGGSVWTIDVTYGHSCFGEDTAEILQWTRQMKHMTVEEQSHYLYGKMKQA